MKKFMVLVMGLVSLGVMAGCDDDSKSVKVPAAVQAAFGEMFPAASHVEWEDKGGYMVADFRSAWARSCRHGSMPPANGT